jgi:hypothetical protein
MSFKKFLQGILNDLNLSPDHVKRQSEEICASQTQSEVGIVPRGVSQTAEPAP